MAEGDGVGSKVSGALGATGKVIGTSAKMVGLCALFGPLAASAFIPGVTVGAAYIATGQMLVTAGQGTAAMAGTGAEKLISILPQQELAMAA